MRWLEEGIIILNSPSHDLTLFTSKTNKMKYLFIFLLLTTACNSARGQVQEGNSTIHDGDTSSSSKTTFSSLGSILILVLIACLIWHLCKRRESEPPSEQLQNVDEFTDTNNPTRPRRNNRRRWYRRNRNHFHQNPNMAQNVIVQPVIHVGVNPQDMNPPVGDGMFGNPGLPNVPPPPAYSERSDNRAPYSIPQAHCAMQTNYGYAPNFNQHPPVSNVYNSPFAPDFGQTNMSATAYIERKNNPRFPPNPY